ncbi:hypothetical protein KK120_18715 [Virgibacillus dakarensis]|nr:hypothetical protein [Virgibacillus dakarensis]
MEKKEKYPNYSKEDLQLGQDYILQEGGTIQDARQAFKDSHHPDMYNDLIAVGLPLTMWKSFRIRRDLLQRKGGGANA